MTGLRPPGYSGERLKFVPTERRTPSKTLLVLIALASIAGSFVVIHGIIVSNQDDEYRDPVIRIANETSTTWYFVSGFEEFDPDCVFVLEVHNCTGMNGTVEIWTYHLIDTFYYHGQEDVYVGSINTKHYLDGVLVDEEWRWLGNLTCDYRAGLWVPSDGLEFRHSANQTFGNAVLIALDDTVAIPEFGNLVALSVVMLAVVLVIGKRRK